MTITAYPLAWPTGWKRTDPYMRTRSRFSKSERKYSSTPGGSSWMQKRDLTISDGTNRVIAALRILGVQEGDAIISTNLLLRLDGLPRSGQSEPAAGRRVLEKAQGAHGGLLEGRQRVR